MPMRSMFGEMRAAGQCTKTPGGVEPSPMDGVNIDRVHARWAEPITQKRGPRYHGYATLREYIDHVCQVPRAEVPVNTTSRWCTYCQTGTHSDSECVLNKLVPERRLVPRAPPQPGPWAQLDLFPELLWGRIILR